MVYLIGFPTKVSCDIRSFSTVGAAESAAERMTGAVFVLASLSEATLSVLPTPLLLQIYNTTTEVKLKSFKKREGLIRVLPLIETLSRPGEETGESTMATKKKGAAKKKAAAKKPAAKKAAATTEGASRPGRRSSLVGKKLYKTGVRDEAEKGHKTSRRSTSYAAITKGMKYETALTTEGIHKDDIAILIRRGHIEAR